MKAPRICQVLFMAWAFAGCADVSRKPVYPVTGQVLYEGKPVPHAAVTLVLLNSADTDKERPSAVSDRQGRFTLTTYRKADGAPAGEYVVLVEARRQIVKDGDSDFSDNYLPPRYSDPGRSDIKVQVAPGSNDLGQIKLRR